MVDDELQSAAVQTRTEHAAQFRQVIAPTVHLDSDLHSPILVDPAFEIGLSAGHGVGYVFPDVEGQYVFAGHGVHAVAPAGIY